MQIRSKNYAEKAYPLVENIKGQVIESKYRTLALTFPTMIMQSGLAQAIGFLMAKGESEHKKMLNHLTELLHYPTAGGLHTKVLSADITEYQLLTRNAIEASSWLKRYTQALLEKQK